MRLTPSRGARVGEDPRAEGLEGHQELGAVLGE